MKATVGQILVNSILPEDLRDYSRVLDKKGLKKLIEDLYNKHGPDVYRRVLFDLIRIGERAAYFSGGFSFGPEELKTLPSIKRMLNEAKIEVEKIINNKNLTVNQKKELIINKLITLRDKSMDYVFEEAKKQNNPLYHQVASGMRGSPDHILSLIGADFLYIDHKNRPIALPVLTNFSEGMDLLGFFASSFGERRGVIGSKLCLSENTEIKLASGDYKRIKDISVGDQVLTFDCDSEKIVVSCVKNVFDRGEQIVIPTVWSDDIGNFYHLESTINHEIYLINYSGYFKKITLQALLKLPKRLRIILACDEFGIFRLKFEKCNNPITVHCYDLEVDHHHHNFILKNNIVVGNSVQQTGALSKSLIHAAHRLVVVGNDVEKPTKFPNYIRGLPVRTDDEDNVGALLAADFGPYKKDTVLTPQILADLKSRGYDQILVRSVLINRHPEGGVYAKDVGVREYGRLPYKGEFVGIVAAQALSEPLTQAQLNVKHTGGAATGKALELIGYPLINQLVSVPKSYPGGATHSTVDGKVEKIEDAPQGGKFITIAGIKHYLPAQVEPTIKIGETVEAGDVISTGLPNPALIVKYKGIGEGRKYLMELLLDAYKKSDIKAHRRNIELIVSALVDHVVLKSYYKQWWPNDVVYYHKFENEYEPRPNSKIMPVDKALGQYLEAPVLHYSIGTKIRPSTVQTLKKFGIKEILVNSEPVNFDPIMVRIQEVLSKAEDDWLVKFLGPNLKRNILASILGGEYSDELSTSYVPALVRAEQFGRIGLTAQPKLDDKNISILKRPRSILDEFEKFIPNLSPP